MWVITSLGKLNCSFGHLDISPSSWWSHPMIILRIGWTEEAPRLTYRHEIPIIIVCWTSLDANYGSWMVLDGFLVTYRHDESQHSQLDPHILGHIYVDASISPCSSLVKLHGPCAPAQPSPVRCVAQQGAPGLHSPGLQNESDTAEDDHLRRHGLFMGSGYLPGHSNVDIPWLLYHHHLCIYYLSYKLGT